MSFVHPWQLHDAHDVGVAERFYERLAADGTDVLCHIFASQGAQHGLAESRTVVSGVF